MKIKAYQAGGPFSGLGVVYTPFTGAATKEAAASSSGKKGSSDNNKLANEIISMVKENGLDSDVTKFLSKAQGILDTASDPMGEGITMGDVLQIQKLANQVKINNENYNKAVESLNKEEAWGEIALTNRGYLYALNKDGDVVNVSAKDYEKNPDKYQMVLTNQDLLSYRERNTDTAFNQNILHDIQNAVGTKTLVDYLNNLIGQFGTTKNTNLTEEETSNIKAGIKKIKTGYKVSKSTEFGKGSDKEMAAAIRYLYSALPNTFKHALDAKAAANGIDAGQMLGAMVSANTDSEYSKEVDKAYTEQIGGGAGAAAGASQLTQMNYLGKIASGDYGAPRPVSLIAKGASPTAQGKINTMGWDVGPIIGHNKETLHKQTVSQLLANGWGLQAANTGSITFGDRHISAEEANALYWNGADHLNVVQLPATKDKNGNLVPDFSAAQKVEQLNKMAEGRTKMEVQEYIKNNLHGYDVQFNEKTKKWEIANVQTVTFLTFVATASDDAIDLTDADKLYLEKVSKYDGEILKDHYNSVVRYGKMNPTKEDKPNKAFDKAGKNSFYRGNVYIPIESPYSGWMVSGNDPYYSKDTFSNVGEKMQIKQAIAESEQKNINTRWS